MTTTTGVATSFIDFTRASNATVTDSDGFVKWAPHNLLLASESFDAASWLKTNAGSTTPTVTANAAVAPNGTTTAETVALGAIDAAGDSSVVYQTFTAVDATYRGGVYVKAATGGDVGKKVWMFMYDSAYRGVASVTLTTEWQLLSSTATLTAGSNRELYIATIGSTNGGENQGAVSVHLWGAALYRSDLAMQPNTSAYPLYNPTTPKNLLGYTEDYSGTGWARSSVTVSGPVVAPNGLSTADTITSTSSVATTVGIYSTISFGIGSTISIYAKAGTSNIAWVSSDAAQSYAIFNLATESVIASANGTPSITPVGGGWYRMAVSNVTVAGTYFIAGGKDSYTSGAPWANGTWTSGNTVHLWGAQVSNSASLDSYVPVYGAAVTSAAYYGPRRDFDPVTLACKGLLVEEQRANLLLHSAAFDVSATWTDLIAGTGTNAVRTANAGVSPDGASAADRLQLTLNGGTTTNDAVRIRQSATPSAGAATFSVWLKSYDGVSTYTMALGAVGSQAITVTGQWQRFVFSFTAAGSATGFDIFIRGAQTPTHSNSVDVLAWGAQLEAGSFATSYIPTGAATATRNADVASVSTQAFPYSSTEGTLVVAWQLAQLSGSPAAIHLTDAAENNRIRINAHLAGINRSTITAAGSLVDNIDTSSAATGITKYALGGKSADYAVYRNGSAGGTSTNAGFPSGCTEMRIGRDAATGNFNGHIRQITYIPRRLANAELQTRTS